jgi:hypothetical protein
VAKTDAFVPDAGAELCFRNRRGTEFPMSIRSQSVIRNRKWQSA